MAAEPTDPIERWIAKRRVTLVLSILKGKTSIAESARTHGLTVAEERIGVPLLTRRRECPPGPTEGRRSLEERADQEAEAEDRGLGAG